MLEHKYRAGDRVIVAASSANQNVRAGVYTIVKALPIAGRGCQYRARNSSDTHERVFDEESLVHEANAAAAYTARNEAVLRVASPGWSTSPQMVEATLASISAEVTAEAVERRRDEETQR